MSDNNDFLFFEDQDDTKPVSHKAEVENKVHPKLTEKWKIMMVDDEPEVHRITRLVLSRFEFEGKGLEFVSAYSGKEARGLLKEHPDIALILLDVVMEEDDAGLKLVKYIREELCNKLVRIILRTGQPGQAPEEKVIVDYDINDYKDKTELTSQKLFTEVVSSLRAYRDVSTIETNRLGLRKILNSYNYIFEMGTVKDYTNAILKEMSEILSHNHINENDHPSGFSVVRNNDYYYIISTVGRFDGLVDEMAHEVVSSEIIADLEAAHESEGSIYRDESLVMYLKNKIGSESLIYFEDRKKLSMLDKGLIEVFCTNISAVNESIINRSRYEAEKEQRYLTEALYELNKRLTSTFDLDEVMTRLLQSILNSIPSQEIKLVLKENGKYSVAAGIGISQSNIGKELSNKEYEYEVLQLLENTKLPLLIGDVHNCIYLRKEGDCSDCMCSLMAIPIIHHSNLLGAVIMWKGEADSFRRKEKDIAETFTNQAVIAIVNAKLYSEVSSRRTSVKNLLNNAGQGFLSFGEDLYIDEEYSYECERIFARKLWGLKISELFFQESEDKSFWEEALRSVFKETAASKRDIMISLLHKEIAVNGRSVELSYKLIRHENRNKIMIILTDVTEKRILESEIEKERQTLQMVVNVVKNHYDFINSVRDYNIFCTITVYEIIRSSSSLEHALLEIFRNIHTYKGTFSQLGIINITNKLHKLENHLQDIKNSSIKISTEMLEEMVREHDIVGWIDEDLQILCNILGEQFVYQDKIITVQQSRLLDIEQKVIQLDNHVQYEEILKDIKQLRYKPFRELLISYTEYVARMAERLEKLVKPFEIEGGYFTVDTDIYSSLAKSLVHIFRNAADHGLETYEERLVLGKEESGVIRCSVELNDSKVIIRISDDGRGLELDKIKARALEKGICSTEEISSMTEDDIKMLIFKDDFSTNYKVTELSGRGYGLSAVKQEVERLGGDIGLETIAGTGTSFYISVPHSE